MKDIPMLLTKKIGSMLNLKRIFNSSLKAKLILILVVVSILSGTVSIISNIKFRSYITSLDDMIHITVLANTIPVTLDGIANSSMMSEYIVDKKPEKLQNVSGKIEQSKGIALELSKIVKQEKGKSKVDELLNQISTCEESVKMLAEDAKKGNVENAIGYNENINRCIALIKPSVDEIISGELDYQKTERARLKAEANVIQVVVIIALIVISVLGILISYIFISKVTATLKKLAKYAQLIDVVNLQVDRLTEKTSDDIAVLINSYNMMGENLRNLISGINQSSMEVSRSAELLKVGAEQSTIAIEHISATVQQVSDGAVNQAEQSGHTAEVVSLLIEGNMRVYDNVNGVMNASGRAIAAAEAGNEKVQQLLDQIRVIEEKIIETQSVTEVLKRHSEEIRKILDTISNIASQTNLLALNAAIEAARAGEYGRGFAVVANEIKKLAGGSANATLEIASMIKDIQSQSQKVADSMVVGVEEIKEGFIMAQDALMSFSNIVQTSNEVEGRIKKVTGEIEKMVEDIRKVDGMSKNILEIANQFSANSQDVSAAVEEEMANLEEVSSSSLVMNDMALKLQSMITRFKL